MLLDVPFLPRDEYVGFLRERADRLASVHFSLADPALADARQRLRREALDGIVRGLNRLGGVDKFLLVNARLHRFERYFDEAGLRRAASALDRLTSEAGLTGVVFSDGYWLQALSDAHPEVCSRLEAVPSINTMPDSPGRVFAGLELIEGTAFRPPSRLVPDRALNRDPAGLRAFVRAVRERVPAMRFLLMANEGCLYQCPYKPAHDAHVALVVEGLCGDRTFAVNRELGCVRRMLADPGLMLGSPFIRPEDAEKYADMAHGLKICGRNRGAEFLMRAVDAYLDGTHHGNLLDLMDAMGDLADRVRIPNRELPPDFFDRVTGCAKDCGRCGWCASLAHRLAARTDPGLGRFGA